MTFKNKVQELLDGALIERSHLFLIDLSNKKNQRSYTIESYTNLEFLFSPKMNFQFRKVKKVIRVTKMDLLVYIT